MLPNILSIEFWKLLRCPWLCQNAFEVLILAKPLRKTYGQCFFYYSDKISCGHFIQPKMLRRKWLSNIFIKQTLSSALYFNMLLRPSLFLFSVDCVSFWFWGWVGRSDKKNKSLTVFTLETDNPSSKSVKIDGKQMDEVRRIVHQIETVPFSN